MEVEGHSGLVARRHHLHRRILQKGREAYLRQGRFSEGSDPSVQLESRGKRAPRDRHPRRRKSCRGRLQGRYEPLRPIALWIRIGSCTHCTGTATTLPSACQQAAQIRPRQVTRIRETHQEIVAQRPDQVERRQNVAPGERASSRLPGDGNSAGLCRAAERAAARCVHPRGKVRWTGPAGAATVAWTFGVPRTLRWRNANAPAARSSQGYSNFLVAQTGNIPAGNGTFLAAHGRYATSAEKPNDSGSYRFLDSETVECSNAASQTVTSTGPPRLMRCSCPRL
jgi:hypothetical protein